MAEVALCAGGCGKPALRTSAYAWGHKGGCDRRRGSAVRVKHAAARSAPARAIGCADAVAWMEAEIATLRAQLGPLTEAWKAAEVARDQVIDRLELLEPTLQAMQAIVAGVSHG